MKKQSFSGFVRQQLGEIDRKLQAGFSMESMLSDFSQNGFKTTLKTFRSTIFRARKSLAKKHKSSGSTTGQHFDEQFVADMRHQLDPTESTSEVTTKPSVPPAPGSFKSYKKFDPDKFRVDEHAAINNPFVKNL